MSRFNQDQKLTVHSKFEDISQETINAIYLTPYPGYPDQRPDGINRTLHGAVHVTRSVMNALVFIELYHAYAPELVVGPSGNALSDEDTKLLLLAVLYHDAANINESEAYEAEHENIFMQHMRSIGYTDEVLLPFAYAISHKDAAHPKTFLQKIVHDADCIDILRVIKHSFDKNYLDIIKDLQHIPEFMHELDQIIASHKETVQFIEGDSIIFVDESPNTLHVDIEKSANCFLSIKATLLHMLGKQVASESVKRGLICNLSYLTSEYVNCRTLYNRVDVTQFMAMCNAGVIGSKYNDLYRAIEEINIDAFISALDNLYQYKNPDVVTNEIVYVFASIMLKIVLTIHDENQCYMFISFFMLQNMVSSRLTNQNDECVSTIAFNLIVLEKTEVFECFASILSRDQLEKVATYLLRGNLSSLNIVTIKHSLSVLFNAGFSLNSFDSFRQCTFLCSIINSNIFSFDFLKWLTKSHVEPLIWDQSNLLGSTPLNDLVNFECIDCIEFVLSQGQNLNVVDFEILRPVDKLYHNQSIFEPSIMTYKKREAVIQLFRNYGSESVLNKIPTEIEDFSVLRMLKYNDLPQSLESSDKYLNQALRAKRELGWSFVSANYSNIRSQPIRKVTAFGMDFTAYDYTNSDAYKFLVHTINTDDSRIFTTIETGAEFINTANRNFSCSLVDNTHGPAIGHNPHTALPLQLILDIPYSAMISCYPCDISSPIDDDTYFNKSILQAQSVADKFLASIALFELQSQGYISPPTLTVNRYGYEKFPYVSLPMCPPFNRTFALKPPLSSVEQVSYEYLYFNYAVDIFNIDDEPEDNYLEAASEHHYNEMVISSSVNAQNKVTCKGFMIDVRILKLYEKYTTDETNERNQKIIKAVLASGLPLVLVNTSTIVTPRIRDEANMILVMYLKYDIALKYHTCAGGLFPTKSHLHKLKAGALENLTRLVKLEEKYDLLNNIPAPKHLMYFYNSLRSDLRLHVYDAKQEDRQKNEVLLLMSPKI